MNKKGITGVVATAILLVVVTFSIVAFQNWYNDYSSITFVKIETDGSAGGLNSKIEDMIGNDLYFRNGHNNLSLQSIKIGNISCENVSNTYTKGILKIDLSNCTEYVEDSQTELLVITDKGIFNKDIFLSLEGCTLNSVSASHGGTGLFYNSSSVTFGSSCISINRKCNNGIFMGDSSFSYPSCFVGVQDITPDVFSFNNQTNVELETLRTSNTLTPTGYQGSINVNISGQGSPQISVDGGSWVTSSTITPGQTLRVRLTSSSSSLITRVANIEIGNYTTSWSVRTRSIIDCSSLPYGDWVAILGNSAHGTNDFCVMKYEAKNVGGVATSQASGVPWTSISWYNAKTECTDLGPNYHLIQEDEWLTIAREIENNGLNWNTGTVGSGFLFSGHNDYSTSSAIAASSTDTDGYYGTGDSTGATCDTTAYYSVGDQRGCAGQKRTFRTKYNNQYIWDLAGNAYEWVDETIYYNSRYEGGSAEWEDYHHVYTEGEAVNMPALKEPGNDWNSQEGMGRYFDGSLNYKGYNDPGGYSDDYIAFIRGGSTVGWGRGDYAGLYALTLRYGRSCPTSTVDLDVHMLLNQ